jgi:Mg2+/Co2+ transporter CorB
VFVGAKFGQSLPQKAHTQKKKKKKKKEMLAAVLRSNGTAACIVAALATAVLFRLAIGVGPHSGMRTWS